MRLVIATILREHGSTGVQTHIGEFQRYLRRSAESATLITPYSWARPLTYLVFALRPLALERLSKPLSVLWYRHWHEAFLYRALRRHLAEAGECVVYAQEPVAARAALRARLGPHQRVIMAVHFEKSQADEWVIKKHIKSEGKVFRSIRRSERSTIPKVDGLVYVSEWARIALLTWLPEVTAIRTAVISNFVSPHEGDPHQDLGDLVTLGSLEHMKNHRFLLDVLAAAKNAGHLFTLDVFGDGSLRNDLSRQVQSLGLCDHVRFHGSREDVRDFLPGYRAYVHASTSESSSLAIMEAMSAGLPIVAGDIGPISELCDDGVEGRFWPLSDPVQAAAILTTLVTNEPLRLTAADAARKRFARDFDANVVAPKLRYFLANSPIQKPAPHIRPARSEKPLRASSLIMSKHATHAE